MLKDYLVWHFYEKPRDLIRVTRLWLRALNNYFSISILLRTLFYPWHRDVSTYEKGTGISERLNAWANNLISRGIGAIARLVVVLIGAISMAAVFAVGIIVVIGWFFVPLFILLIIGIGARIL
ncbi:hypothetical protein M1534_03360 [Patescibacteria group bacterium]|nr:hypothetical protein [Patescibacteria group bacterium]